MSSSLKISFLTKTEQKPEVSEQTSIFLIKVLFLGLQSCSSVGYIHFSLPERRDHPLGFDDSVVI